MLFLANTIEVVRQPFSLSCRPPSRSESAGGGSVGRSGWREQRCVTKIKEAEDREEWNRRKALTEERSPAQLAQMTSVADLPMPRPLETLFGTVERKKKKPSDEEEDAKRWSIQIKVTSQPKLYFCVLQLKDECGGHVQQASPVPEGRMSGQGHGGGGRGGGEGEAEAGADDVPS